MNSTARTGGVSVGPDQLSWIVATALERHGRDMSEKVPAIAREVSARLTRIPVPGDPPEQYLDPRNFPILQLPCWLGNTLGRPIEAEFLGDLCYSSLNGYCYIRLIDNVMDGDGADELRKLLPAAGYFHAHFQGVFPKYFGHDHDFWTLFDRVWCDSAESTLQDALMEDITEENFRRASSRKFAAATIPIAAVAYRYDSPRRITPWQELVDALGAWYQMVNDFFDWHHDSQHGIHTYFLSEAKRLRAPDESLDAWFVREGFDWGVDTLRRWMQELQGAVRHLGSIELMQFLRAREGLFEEQVNEGARARDGLRAVFVALQQTAAGRRPGGSSERGA